MNLTHSLLAATLLAAPLATAAVRAETVPARKPLTFRDSGIYGWWQPYFWEGPFDFVITQAFVVDDPSLRPGQNGAGVENAKRWNEYLKKARAAGKRVLVVTTPGQGQHLTEAYFEGLVTFLENIDHEELYAITLSEEHIFWDGRAEQMAEYYHRVKEKFPDLPVYQFYTNTSRANALPGFTWPWVPADGWMIDEYSATPDDLAECLRRYRMLGQPVVNIVYAAPFYSSSGATSIQYHQSIFDGQLRVLERYNVPTAYFCYDGPEGAGDEGWPWLEAGHPDTKAVFQQVLAAAERAATLPDEALNNWDGGGEPIPTVLTRAEDGSLGYRESFNLRMKAVDPDYTVEHDFMERSEIDGLRYMEWEQDPTRIVISADESGSADAAITNLWSTPEGERGRFTAEVKFVDAPNSAAEVVFEVSPNGYDWQEAAGTISESGTMSVKLDQPLDQLYTRLRVAATDAEPQATLAEVDWIQVRGEVAP